MSATIPDAYRDLLEGPVYAGLTTMMPDGQPQSTVVWVNCEGEYVKVNSARGRQKDKNMRANPKVTLLAIDPNNPFRWIEVRGVVDEITEEGGLEHINELARLYVGAPEYYGHAAPAELKGKETRVIYKIRPVRVVTFPD
ncbi:MAG: PPOX class F420-dependent oxidoreductase [Anaerolineae bacterium]|nr:PPOX class F420-dependent oxidoreductase [Anaerolineae bacterium]